jgi:hypothetical protein
LALLYLKNANQGERRDLVMPNLRGVTPRLTLFLGHNPMDWTWLPLN